MLGQRFAPLGDDSDPLRRNAAQPGGGGGIQEAVRMLSLRLPRVLGAHAPVALPLLQSQGGAGLPAPNPAVAALIQQLFGGMAQGMPSGGMMGGAGGLIPKTSFVTNPPVDDPPTDTHQALHPSRGGGLTDPLQPMRPGPRFGGRRF